MQKVLIFGNSGSGKSTLAKELSKIDGLSHFDLDMIAWEPSSPPKRKAVNESQQAIEQFMIANRSWVIEGCYSDLLEIVIPKATEIIFLNLPIEVCIQNAKNRPWEPHKYESKQAQDENLVMLLDWIAEYPTRTDTFSKSSHEALFNAYQGKRTMYTSNERYTNSNL